MSEYLFHNQNQEPEVARMKMIEQLFDPVTIQHLETTGVDEGWRCLELGAGAGSVMRWMRERVGSSGSVVAIDRKVEHLRGVVDPSIQLIDGDFADAQLDGDLDLAHCRFVLIHNRNGDALLRKMCDLLRPGGHLVVEEPDFTCARHLNQHADGCDRRIHDAVCRAFEDRSLDPAYGLTLPRKIESAGLEIVDVDSRLHLARGGSLMAQLMAASTSALKNDYIATGATTAADIESHLENTRANNYWSVYYSTISIVAKKTLERNPIAR